VVFDPNGSTTISVESSPTKVDYSIYEGRTCAGQVRHVFSRGQQVVADGAVVGRAGHGRFLARGSTLAPG
jgi:dihydropyrimidinase